MLLASYYNNKIFVIIIRFLSRFFSLPINFSRQLSYVCFRASRCGLGDGHGRAD